MKRLKARSILYLMIFLIISCFQAKHLIAQNKLLWSSFADFEDYEYEDCKVSHKGDFVIYCINKINHYNYNTNSIICFYDIRTRNIDSVVIPDRSIFCAAISPGDSLLALFESAQTGNEISIYSIKNRNKINTLTLSSLNDLSPDNLFFNENSTQITLMDRYYIKINSIDIAKDSLISNFELNYENYWKFASSLYGNYVAAVKVKFPEDDSLFVFNTFDRKPVNKAAIKINHLDNVKIAVSDEGNRVCYQNYHDLSSYHLVDFRKSTNIDFSISKSDMCYDLVFSKSSDSILIKLSSDYVIVNLNTLKEVNKFNNYCSNPDGFDRLLSYSDNVEIIAAHEYRNTSIPFDMAVIVDFINIFDTDHSNSLIEVIPEGHTTDIKYLASSGKGDLLASSDENFTIIWNAATGRVKNIINNAGQLQFSYHNNLIYIIDSLNTNIYHINDPSLNYNISDTIRNINLLVSHTYPVIIDQRGRNLYFKEDSTFKILSTEIFNNDVKILKLDKTERKLIALTVDSLFVWELAGFTKIRNEKLNDAIIQSAEYISDISPNLDMIVTIGKDNGESSFWDLNTGVKLFPVSPKSKSYSVKFNLDGKIAIFHTRDKGQQFNYKEIYEGFDIAGKIFLKCNWGGSCQAESGPLYNAYEPYLLMSDGRHIATTYRTGLLNYSQLCEQMFSPVENQQIPESKIEVFPNPTAENITLKLPEEINQINQVKIANSMGMTADVKYLITQDKITINLNGFAPGVYFVILDTNEGRIVKKVMKN